MVCNNKTKLVGVLFKRVQLGFRAIQTPKPYRVLEGEALSGMHDVIAGNSHICSIDGCK